MATSAEIFSSDFRKLPYWWEAYAPPETDDDALPASADVVIIGAGYTGICCALTLREAGIEAIVLEAGRPGIGASTRSGGQVSGGVNVQKKALAAVGENDAQRAERLSARLRDADAAMTYVVGLIEKHGIQCGWRPTGRLTTMWLPQHYEAWQGRMAQLNANTQSRARMIPREALDAEIGSSVYHGAALIERAGHLHPAQLYGGMLAAARAAGAKIHGQAPVARIARVPGGYDVTSGRGTVRAREVVIATNGYTGPEMAGLDRRVVPIATYMIATDELAPGLAEDILPTNRAVSESRRVVNHYRLSPDGRRLLFGGRARFTPTSEETTARLLYRAMLKRFPQLAGARITHSWGGKVAMTLDAMPHIGGADGLHYALGCNGSGVAMMSYLGHSLGRKIAAQSRDPINAFDMGDIPGHPFYSGNTWFLFAIGSWYQARDAYDHWRAR
ncbi:NAD(P)/FAD-dependent oxidoreductase [Achromobacter aloeverae]|uniref:FAD-dependent oxidoreductase n=1 Tax=Achromobacter aloeverae TaxID=1750518 RepID=A0A4Q1HLP7_9BURK|nr:FAD-binding oxidoreductase [Achromobacter aloeverae]RXN91278.1 FAD-dependent oxidoreductase [Achromobacter aloeverae]